MPWGRCDDGHYRHRKVTDLDDDLRKGCIALFWLAVSWCNDQLTDGRVPMSAVRLLGGEAAEADELVRVGLWERDHRAYRIHDFLDYNKSREQVLADRAQRSLAGQSSAQKRWGNSGSSNDSLHDSSNGSLDAPSNDSPNENDAPYPVSRIPVFPSPAPSAREGLPHLDEGAVTFLEGMTGRAITTAGQKQLTEYDRQLGDHGFDAVVKAYRRTAKAYPSKPTAVQLVWAARKVLEPIADAKALRDAAREEAADEEARAHRARLEATQERLRKLRGDAA